MRFIPSTHMQAGGCMSATANGGVSGSFVSGSQTYVYHEFKLSNRNVSETFLFTVEKGFTTRARFILIGGGGGGGFNGAGSYGLGGGGGGSDVIDYTGQLYTGDYQLRVGHGGLPAEPDDPITPTYNGGDGDYTEVLGGPYVSTARLRAVGGDGGYGDNSVGSTYLHGGDSGNGNTGGSNFGNNAGGGAGFSSNGVNGTSARAGNGGTGTTITLPYSSPGWGGTSEAVGGGGGGSADSGDIQGTGTDGGGNGGRIDTGTGQDGTRYTGGGGGGSANFASVPRDGTQGGDGILIIYYPTGSCY